MRHFKISLSAAVGLSLLALGAGHSQAALTTTGDSIPAFTGIAPFSGSGTTGILDANVEYAVFAPGQAPASLFGSSSNLSSPAFSDYVYAYVVDNVGTSGAGDLSVNLLNVGYANGAILENIGHSEALGGNQPIVGQGAASNSYYNLFYADPITPGTSSDILYFTSPQPPDFASSTTGNGGLNDPYLLPSPAVSVPEPSSLGLLAAGGLALLGRRRRVAR